MGRASQFIEFINKEKMPRSDEQTAEYTHIGINDNLKKARKKYRKSIKTK